MAATTFDTSKEWLKVLGPATIDTSKEFVKNLGTATIDTSEESFKDLGAATSKESVKDPGGATFDTSKKSVKDLGAAASKESVKRLSRTLTPPSLTPRRSASNRPRSSGDGAITVDSSKGHVKDFGTATVAEATAMEGVATADTSKKCAANPGASTVAEGVTQLGVCLVADGITTYQDEAATRLQALARGCAVRRHLDLRLGLEREPGRDVQPENGTKELKPGICEEVSGATEALPTELDRRRKQLRARVDPRAACLATHVAYENLLRATVSSTVTLAAAHVDLGEPQAAAEAEARVSGMRHLLSTSDVARECRPECPAGHPLLLFMFSPHAGGCDLCGARPSALCDQRARECWLMGGCDVCDWDVCTHCLQR